MKTYSIILTENEVQRVVRALYGADEDALAFKVRMHTAEREEDEV